MAYDILIDLVASALFVLLGFYSKKLLNHYRLRNYRAIWYPFYSFEPEVAIVLTTRPGPLPRSTMRVSLNEMLAFSEIQAVFRELNIKSYPFLGNEVDKAELASKHIVCLGGPKANNTSALIWASIQDKIPFYFDIENQEIHVAHRIYKPEYDNEGRVKCDYGLVVRIRNPFSSNLSRYTMIAFGCHGHATYGAIRGVLREDLVQELFRKVKRQDFAAIVQVNLHNHKFVSTILLEYYVLLSEKR